MQHILPVLRQACQKRDRLGLRVWVEQAWVGLGGPLCAPDMDGLLDAENFLQLLEQAEVEGVGLELDWLSLRLQKLYMSAGNPDCNVHLMTLHKAKGLEFDRVIIPQLDRLPRSDGREILLWDEHSNAQGQRSFLLAADDLGPADAPTLYNYLKAQRRQKMLLEATRLLYVGATRAISHLLLTASVSRDEKTAIPREPSVHSLLSPIWQTFAQQMTIHPPCAAVELADSGTTPTATDSLAAPRFTRVNKLIRGADFTTGCTSSYCASRQPRRAQHWNRRASGHGGVVTSPRATWKARRARSTALAHGAAAAGPLGRVSLHDALKVVVSSITQALQSDHIGRWVLSSGHAAAHSEWALTTVNSQGVVEDIVIDRSFIDRETGQRWVIDYKNSRPARGESLDDFVARETTNYLPQLRLYCDTVRQLGQEPLRCALFFTSLGRLHRVPELDLPAAENWTKPCDD